MRVKIDQKDSSVVDLGNEIRNLMDLFLAYVLAIQKELKVFIVSIRMSMNRFVILVYLFLLSPFLVKSLDRKFLNFQIQKS